MIPRPGSSDRSLRWLKEALIRQGVAQELVQPLSWHSFRVFIPDCAYLLGIPRTQRQYLGNLQTESTDPQKKVREDLSHEDWDDKPGPSDQGSPVKSGSFQLVSEDERPEQQSDGPGSGKSKPSAVTARSEEPSQWSPRMKSFHQWGR